MVQWQLQSKWLTKSSKLSQVAITAWNRARIHLGSISLNSFTHDHLFLLSLNLHILMEAVFSLSPCEYMGKPSEAKRRKNLRRTAAQELLPLKSALAWIHRWSISIQVCSLFHKSTLIYFWYNPLGKEIDCWVFVCLFVSELVLPCPRQMH